MSLIRGRVDDEKGKDTLFARKVWNLICRALLMSGTSLKAIANKMLDVAKKNLGEELPQTEQTPMDPTPLINPIYKGNAVVELGNKIAGTDLTEPQSMMLNPQELEAIKNIKLPEQAPTANEEVISTTSQEVPMEVQQEVSAVAEPVIPTANQEVVSTVSQVVPEPEKVAPVDQPVFNVVEPVAPTINQEVISTVSQVVPMPEQPVKADEPAIPSIVPPTFSTAVVNENIGETISEESQEVVSAEPQEASLKDEEEASVESAITMATVNTAAVPREPAPELQTPQEFDNESQVQEKVDEVSARYIDAVSLLEKYKSDAEATLVALQEANEAQSRALSEIRKQISMLSNIQRMLEQERVGQISSIKEALDNQDRVLNSNTKTQRTENVR